MLFGLPWWAIIPIVAIVGGMILKYREQELKHEEKMRAGSKEVNELRKIVHNLKSRIEHLETQSSSTNEMKKDVLLDDIEIKDEYYSDESDGSTRRKVQN